MVVDHSLREELDVVARRLVESHTAELDLSHVHGCGVMHKLTIALQVGTGSACADRGWPLRRLCRRLRPIALRAFRLRAAADEDDGREGCTQQTSALHHILPCTTTRKD